LNGVRYPLYPACRRARRGCPRWGRGQHFSRTGETVETDTAAHTLQRSHARSQGSVASTLGRCNGLRTRALKLLARASPPVRTVKPLSRGTAPAGENDASVTIRLQIPTPAQRVSRICAETDVLQLRAAAGGYGQGSFASIVRRTRGRWAPDFGHVRSPSHSSRCARLGHSRTQSPPSSEIVEVCAIVRAWPRLKRKVRKPRSIIRR
jgi:hypothetical protein